MAISGQDGNDNLNNSLSNVTEESISLLKTRLELKGHKVFLDVETLEGGKFDYSLSENIKKAKNFVLILTPKALDRCIGDLKCKDWVHREIVTALEANRNIIPIIDDEFKWPERRKLPKDMQAIFQFNGLRWAHHYQDAVIEKVDRFIRESIPPPPPPEDIPEKNRTKNQVHQFAAFAFFTVAGFAIFQNVAK